LAAPAIELVGYIDIGSKPNRVNAYVDANHRMGVDAASGLMPVMVASGMFYGVMETATSGVPTAAASTYGVVPWELSFNPDDQHFVHDPSNSAENTHVIVVLDDWYEISYHVTSLKVLNNTRTNLHTRCMINSTTRIPGSDALNPALLINAGQSNTWTGLSYLNAGDAISVEAREFAASAGDVYAAGQACSLFMRYIGQAYGD